MSEIKTNRNHELTIRLKRGTKTRILIRDGRRCAVCSSTANLEIHHFWDAFSGPRGSHALPLKKYGTPYWETRDEELVTLCGSCHQKNHSIPNSTLAKLLHQIIAQRFGKQEASLMIVRENGVVEFREAKLGEER